MYITTACNTTTVACKVSIQLQNEAPYLIRKVWLKSHQQGSGRSENQERGSMVAMM